MALRLATGEVSDATTVTLPVGSSWMTPEDLENAMTRKHELQALFVQKTMTRELGKFCFISKSNIFADMRPANAARLVYLSTYLRYNSDNLYRTQRTPLNVADLPEVLRVSEPTARRFLNEVCQKYLTIDANGDLHLTPPAFVNGKLPTRTKGEAYQKIYCEAIRSLYRSTPTISHKYLGYVFQILPFISVQYNVLCHNPYETDWEEVQFLTLGELCKAIDLGYTNAKRLREVYSKITFEVNERPELFCSFVQHGNAAEDTRVFVNPHVLYSGTNYKRAETLGGFPPLALT